METNKHRNDQVAQDNEDHNWRMAQLRVIEETDPEKLRKIANNRDHFIQILVAKNPNTPGDLRDALAKSSNPLVGEAAKNTTMQLSGKTGGGSKTNLSGIGGKD